MNTLFEMISRQLEAHLDRAEKYANDQQVVSVLKKEIADFEEMSKGKKDLTAFENWLVLTMCRMGDRLEYLETRKGIA